MTRRRRKGKGKERKEAGKVIVKKHVRRGPLVRAGRKVRWDVVFAAVVIILIGIGVWYGIAHASKGGAQGLTPALTNLYNGIDDLYLTKNPNPNLTLDVFYNINGTVNLGNVTYGVSDFLQYRLFYYHRSVSVPQTQSSKNASRKEVVIQGHGLIILGANYLSRFFNILGYPNMMSDNVSNVSLLILNVRYLEETHHILIKKEVLGTTYVRIPTVKHPVKTVMVKYTYTLPAGKGIKYNVTAVVWYELKYKFPVKALINVNGYKLEFRLEYAQVSHFKLKRV